MSESGYQFGICSVVKNESIYLRATDLNAPPEEVKLDAYLESNRLTAFELSSDEEKELYVDYATQLDDGEAMSLALVNSRGFSMASDDRKARRLFTEEIGDLKRLLSTSQILKEWSEKAGMNTADVKQVLTDVSRRGRFFPELRRYAFRLVVKSNRVTRARRRLIQGARTVIDRKWRNALTRALCFRPTVSRSPLR
jgi:predicted nucleic acid-binding protein